MFSLPTPTFINPDEPLPNNPLALKSAIHQIVKYEVHGRFTRFLDVMKAREIEIQPRWTMVEGVLPVNTFHLEPLRYRPKGQKTFTALSEDMGWNWLFCYMDFPIEAKERLLELARGQAHEWAQRQVPGRESTGEKRIREALQWLFMKEFPRTRPDWMVEPGYVHPLEIDGYCSSLSLGFEFQGQQHYECVEAFGMTDRRKELAERQRVDAFKQYCMKARKGHILTIRYDELPANPSMEAMALHLLKMLDSSESTRFYLTWVSGFDQVDLVKSVNPSIKV